MRILVYTCLCGLIAVLTASCEKTLIPAPEENTLLDGRMEGLTLDEQRKFLLGDEAFNDDIFTSEKGLGPVFVGTSCGSCHAGDGKGHPFVGFTRFGQSDTIGNPYATWGDKGNQLQHKALPGYEPEVLPAGAPHSLFIAPAVTGLGLLDAVPDADLLALADPNDADGDGISGRAHFAFAKEYVKLRENAIVRQGKVMHRFGKKANAYDLLQQSAEAYNQDMGVVSYFEPIDPYSGERQDPEVSSTTLNDIVFYLKTLKAPLPRNEDEPNVIKGKQVFLDIGCGKCHTPALTTGFSSINALSNKTFHPYTDLLLHDLGSELNDGYTEGYALPEEWRTPPLWGLGLSADSQGGTMYLLHDGRAHSIEEAIELHGGEGGQSRGAYRSLSQDQKDQLHEFLMSL